MWFISFHELLTPEDARMNLGAFLPFSIDGEVANSCKVKARVHQGLSRVDYTLLRLTASHSTSEFDRAIAKGVSSVGRAYQP